MAVTEEHTATIPITDRKIKPWGSHIYMSDQYSIEDAKTMLARCIVDTLIKGKQLQVFYQHNELMQTHNYWWKCELREPLPMTVTGEGVEELDGV